MSYIIQYNDGDGVPNEQWYTTATIAQVVGR